MQTFEVGVLPQSNFFFFSPTAQTQSLFYYQTMCGHFYCTEEYYIKRESVFASSSRLYQLLSLLDNPRRSPPAEEKRRLDQPGHRLYPHPHRGEDLPVSVAEISAQVGYPNSSNLITLFTQRVGCSPSQFRKENRLSHR